MDTIKTERKSATSDKISLKQIVEKYYRLAILLDNANQILIEIKPHLKQLPKHYATNAIKYGNLLQKEIDKQLGDTNAMIFGDIADELRKWLDETIVYKHEQEN